MIRRPFVLKSVAVFFIFEILGSTIFSSLSFALTSGPTAPEATSFEPVDTTDIVNTITGDFVYNIPLLEVPGPAGGYPVSLSYHGNVLPDVDASWVGLNWSLNPGSLNRIVNGLPDDINGANSTNRVFWEGGETTVSTYGLSYGIGNVATVSGGLIFANDTYKGRGVGGYGGVSYGIANTPLSVNLQVTASPYGGSDASIGLGAGLRVAEVQGMKVGINASTSINSQGEVASGFGVGVSAGKMNNDTQTFGGSLLGASISSGSGGRWSTSVAGFSQGFNNSRFGKTSTSENNFSIDIPVWYGINVHLGRDYTRYWMNEKETYLNYGSLYYPTIPGGDLSTKIFDTYHVQGTESIITGKDPQRYSEGSFADYDQYSVNAQGIGGNIRPYHYILSLTSQDVLDQPNNTKEILNYSIPQHSVGVQYGFVNDFSNRVLNDAPDIQLNKTLEDLTHPSDPGPDYDAWKARLEAAYSPGQNIPLVFPYKSAVTGIEGHGQEPGEKRVLPFVPGSNHVEYFTNEEIIEQPGAARARGFVDCNAAGFIREKKDGKIGSFAITNGSGVTYHFSLPAYSFAEAVYSQNKDVADKVSFNNLDQVSHYAYTWYLTGVTGPDFIDNGPDGIPDGKLNAYDWGYWVALDYGKWTDVFKWRNPAEGFNEDIDNKFQSFSKGKKQLYYLNSIRTATHTAFFVKELRADGKSGTSPFKEAVQTRNLDVKWVDEGGFDVQPITKTTIEFSDTLVQLTDDPKVPVSTLALKNILLFENKDIGVDHSQLYQASDEYDHVFFYTDEARNGNGDLEVPIHLGKNVLDRYDLEAQALPVDKAIRTINFEHDYSLVPGTLNSFDATGQLYACEPCEDFIPDNALTQAKLGKLTLKSVSFKGKGGVDGLPPIRFDYEHPSPASTAGNIASINGDSKIAIIAMSQSHQFQIGDIVVLRKGSETFYGFVKSQTGAGLSVRIISSQMPAAGLFVDISRTKNPPYDKDLKDIWGYYKADYTKKNSRNLARFPTDISAKNTDVWALRQIQTSLGAVVKIQYETDTYGHSVLSKNLTIPLRLSGKTTETTPPGTPAGSKIFLEAQMEEDAPVDFSTVYAVGDQVELVGAASGCNEVVPEPGTTGDAYECNEFMINTGEVQEVSARYIRVRVYFGYQMFQSFFGCVMNHGVRDIQWGGGTRVKSVGIYDPMRGETRSTTYTYEFNNKSSGVTSCEPLNVEDLTLNSTDADQNEFFKLALLRPFITMFSLSRDIPAPGVYYGKVRIGETITRRDGSQETLPGYSDYEFETMNEGMFGVDKRFVSSANTNGTYRGQTYNNIQAHTVSIRDYTQRLGNLRSVTLFDKDGNKVSQSLNHYLHDAQTGKSFQNNKDQYPALLERFNSQGTMQETFNHARLIRASAESNYLEGLISKKEVYPSVQTGSTTINFKTGITTTSTVTGFDFYSGQVNRMLTTDGYGNSYLTETVPAYKVYPALGLKTYYQTDLKDNKHMLQQEAATYTFKIDAGDNNARIGLAHASASTWSDQVPSLRPGENLSQAAAQAGVWRPHASYSFIGEDQIALRDDGLYPAASLAPFAAWGNNVPVTAGWQKNNAITLYDVNSHALESRDINGNYGAVKMSFDQSRVMATATNASYGEFGYSGAEDLPQNNQFGSDVHHGAGGYTHVAHTGKKALIAPAGTRGFTFSMAPVQRTYRVSVWSSTPDAGIKYKFNSGPPENASVRNVGTAGGWRLLEADIPVATGVNAFEVWCEAGTNVTYFDDFRVHPLDAAMVSYVYNDWGELSHILNSNNLYTEYRYDNFGRVKETYNESFQYGVVRTGSSQYHYKRSQN